MTLRYFKILIGLLLVSSLARAMPREDIVGLINKYNSPTEYTIFYDDEFEGSEYFLSSDIIHIDTGDTSMRTLYHEIGHSLENDIEGEIFFEMEMAMLIYRDKGKELEKAYWKEFNKKETEERGSGCVAIQDIISAITYDETRICYGHTNAYWKGYIFNREAEVFANITSLILLEDERCLKFMEDNMPELLSVYDEFVKGGMR